MRPLWHGHEFSPDELEAWAFEVAEAAIALTPERRAEFLARACEGSQELLRDVASLVDFSLPASEHIASESVCQPGEIVCDCLILRRIGSGGAAEVYKAIQRSVRRLVAVKVLLSVRDDERLALARETARVGQLAGSHVVGVYHADFDSDRPCVVMEYVAGYTLREWLERQRRVDPWQPAHESITSIATQVCDALAEAHARGVVHRDLKPENILLTESGGELLVKVADFGLARHVDSPDPGVMGTPGYISPEQLTGASFDQRADIFSLGVVLYEMTVGRHPFMGDSHAETLANTLRCQPAIAEERLLDRYRTILGKALEKRPERRYQSIADLLTELEGHFDLDSSAVANPFLSEFPSWVSRWSQRHNWGFPAAIASCVWGCVSIALSVLAGASCIRVLWQGEAGETFEILYGYVIEPNAGPWYCIGSSVCLMAGFGLLDAAYRGLARTTGLSLPGSEASGAPLQRIAEINRSVFRVIAPVIVIASVGFVVYPEIVLRDSNAFGWVQADMAGQYRGKTQSELVRAGKMGRLEGVRTTCVNCDFRVKDVFNRAGRYAEPDSIWFSLFLFSALTHEIAFTAFLAFIAGKILLFFALLSRALLATKNARIRLTPDLDDRHDYRFGLGRLDRVYDFTLGFLAICSVGRLSQFVANLDKGTNFFGGNAAFPLIGQPLVVSAVLMVTGVLVLTPLIVFVLLTGRLVERERARLAVTQKRLQERLGSMPSREGKLRIQTEIDEVAERRRVLDRQRLLPTRSRLFWSLLAANLALLLIAPAVISSGAGARELRGLNDSLCAACGNPSPGE
jgi:tRNA A-37 threonylcarbamoyl transferase component Bud32